MDDRIFLPSRASTALMQTTTIASKIITKTRAAFGSGATLVGAGSEAVADTSTVVVLLLLLLLRVRLLPPPRLLPPLLQCATTMRGGCRTHGHTSVLRLLPVWHSSIRQGTRDSNSNLPLPSIISNNSNSNSSSSSLLLLRSTPRPTPKLRPPSPALSRLPLPRPLDLLLHSLAHPLPPSPHQRHRCLLHTPPLQVRQAAITLPIPLLLQTLPVHLHPLLCLPLRQPLPLPQPLGSHRPPPSRLPLVPVPGPVCCPCFHRPATRNRVHTALFSPSLYPTQSLHTLGGSSVVSVALQH
jgi:hypothetical protein